MEHRARASTTIAGLHDLVDVRLGPSEWRPVVQSEVDTFADLTGDHGAIHVDPVYAATTPFGGPIVPGFLTLALVVPLMSEVLDVVDAANVVNYGVDRLRFPAALPVGGSIRLSAVVMAVEAVTGGIHATISTALHLQGSEKPVLVADRMMRYLS